jgi:hypothetical protein
MEPRHRGAVRVVRVRAAAVRCISPMGGVFPEEKKQGRSSIRYPQPYTKLTIVDLKKTHQKCLSRKRNPDTR